MPQASENQAVVTREHVFDGGVALQITINRAEVHNAVDGAAASELLAAWQRFASDERLLVAILHGAGERAFCAGADLSALEQLSAINAGDSQAAAATPKKSSSSAAGLGPMGGSRIVQRKPVITVTQGFTYAGGLELYCHGHIRLAEPQATFSVACRRWGVPLVDGGTVYLPRLLGWSGALPLIITGQRISAERAYQLGLVWELTPAGQGVTRALDMARQICRQPRDAMLADLSSAIDGWHLPIEQALALEAANLAPVAASESMKQGVARFLAGERWWFE